MRERERERESESEREREKRKENERESVLCNLSSKRIELLENTGVLLMRRRIRNHEDIRILVTPEPFRFLYMYVTRHHALQLFEHIMFIYCESQVK